jgi:hypothetical protein
MTNDSDELNHMLLASWLEGRDMPSDIRNMILASCHTELNGRGVGELLTLGTVNKSFRRSVDQLVLSMIKGETKLDHHHGASSLRWEENANHQAAHWIALGCVSFVREAKMRGEPKSKVYVRSFMHILAYKLCQYNPVVLEDGSLRLQARIASALQGSSNWCSNDQAKRIAAGDAFLRMATSRLAPGGQSLLPGFSEEEIRKTLNLAIKSRDWESWPVARS